MKVERRRLTEQGRQRAKELRRRCDAQGGPLLDRPDEVLRVVCQQPIGLAGHRGQ